MLKQIKNMFVSKNQIIITILLTPKDWKSITIIRFKL